MKTKFHNFLLTFYHKIKKDEIIIYAQALTFTSLLTVIPLLGLSFTLSKILIPHEKILDQFFLYLTYYLTPEALQKVNHLIFNLTKKLETFPLGKFSLIFYFIMGSGLLFQIEEVLNKIFESQKKRNFFQRIIFFWLCITLTPFIFLIPFTLVSKIGKFYTLLNLVLIFSFFFLIYVSFPAKEIPKKETFLGATFSTLLWMITSYLFIVYVKYAITYSKIYGSLMIFPLFLLWVFINWLVFLIGAELIVALERKGWRSWMIRPSKPLIKLLVLYILAKNFSENGPVTLDILQKTINIDTAYLESILQELEAQKLIFLKEDVVVLTKYPEKIFISEILEKELIFFENYEKNPLILEFQEKLKIITSSLNVSLKELIS